MEVKGIAGGVTVIDDFGHHPTAMRETLTQTPGIGCPRPLNAAFMTMTMPYVP